MLIPSIFAAGAIRWRRGQHLRDPIQDDAVHQHECTDVRVIRGRFRGGEGDALSVTAGGLVIAISPLVSFSRSLGVRFHR
jgi:hypothetical protein